MHDTNEYKFPWLEHLRKPSWDGLGEYQELLSKSGLLHRHAEISKHIKLASFVAQKEHLNRERLHDFKTMILDGTEEEIAYRIDTIDFIMRNSLESINMIGLIVQSNDALNCMRVKPLRTARFNQNVDSSSKCSLFCFVQFSLF